MSGTPTRNASWILMGLCAVLAIGSLFLHPDAGAGRLPLKYPLLGAGATAVVVLVVRLLRGPLRTQAGDDHAD